MMSRFRKPLLAAIIAVYLLSLSGVPAMAGMIGSVSTSQQVTSQEAKDSEIGTIQRALETQIVKSKLEAYGLTPVEITAKLQGMTDSQIHLLAQASEDLLVAGDGGEALIIFLLIILIILIIMYMSGHRVIVK